MNTMPFADPLFTVLYLDDELNNRGIMEETARAGVRKHLLNGCPEPLPIDVRCFNRPEEMLEAARERIGNRPLAAVIDLSLKEATNSAYSEGGGFQVWAEIASFGRNLPPALSPLALIYTAKDNFASLYDKAQPDSVGSWLGEVMNPIVLTFKQASDIPGSLYTLLGQWVERARGHIIRQMSADDREFLCRQLASEDASDPLGPWRARRAFAIPDMRVEWRGCAATLFPELVGRIATDARSAAHTAARALRTGLPDFVRLLGRLVSEDVTSLARDKRFADLARLPSPITKLDHFRPDLEYNGSDPVPVLREWARPFNAAATLTAAACGLPEGPCAVPHGPIAFLHQLAHLGDGQLSALGALLNGSLGGSEPHCARWHLAGRVPKDKVPACVWFLDTAEPTEPKQTPHGTELLKQFVTALTDLKPAVRRRFPEDPWREFLWYFPLAEEFGWVVRRVTDHNREKYGPGTEPEYHTHIESRAGGSGALALQLLIRTQTDHDTTPDLNTKVRPAILESEPHCEKLSGLHAMVCGQYGGTVQLLFGESQIAIGYHRVSDKLEGLKAYPILDRLSAGAQPSARYDPDVPRVRGVWYLIEITSRESAE
jgi:hypothetical protein